MGLIFKSPICCCVDQFIGPATMVHALLLAGTARGHFCWEHYLFSIVGGHPRDLSAPGEQACSIFADRVSLSDSCPVKLQTEIG